MTETDTATLTEELLRDYSLAALANASELIAEATVLHRHGHYARAYFLGVASVEEIGKAFVAFDGRGRKLSDPAVVSKLRKALEDHRSKITSAFIAWLIAVPNIRDSLMPAINLMIDLRHRREPSMYTDITADSSAIQVPSAVIREKAAFDCIRLAEDCFFHTHRHLAENAPERRTAAEDGLFAMKRTQFQKISNTEDFWWYYVHQVESGNKDFADAVMSYQQRYVKTGTVFQTSKGPSDA
jgi:AbiV family abortive infection protein